VATWREEFFEVPLCVRLCGAIAQIACIDFCQVLFAHQNGSELEKRMKMERKDSAAHPNAKNLKIRFHREDRLFVPKG
jgi:hypothetical protein